MKISIGCDHPAFQTKKIIIQYLRKAGHTVYDCGTFDPGVRTHYPIYGHKLGCLVATKKVDLGIAVCGTGVGIANATNRVRGIRCALVSDPLLAKIARKYFHINVIAMGALVVGNNTALDIVKTFLTTTPYKIDDLSKQELKQIDNLIPTLTNNFKIFDEIIEN